MDIALVTGADAGPGLAIARRLIGMGCRVYALATQFARNPFPHDDFITLTCDLADPAAVTKAAEDILAREGHVTFVVHAARRVATPILDTPVAGLVERINVGLLAPLALVRVTLPWLRKDQGHFLVLCWSGEGAAPGGPVTAAIEGGLHHFADELFEEMRNDGVRVTTIYARPNTETTPEAALALDPQSAVNPELVADAVEQLFRQRPSNVVSTLVIRPAATAETPRLARSSELAGMATRDVQLPPRQNFPPEPERIVTPPRQRPADASPPSEEDFDDEEEDDDDWDPRDEPLREGPADEPREGQPASHGAPRPNQGQGGRPQNYQGGQQGDQGQGRGGRRRRRGGRGRGRQREYLGDRPPGGQPPPSGGENPPPRIPPPVDYPDAEAEAEDRSFARDDSFRTPHDEAEEIRSDGGEETVSREPETSADQPPQVETFRDEVTAPVERQHREPPHRESSNRPPSQQPPRGGQFQGDRGPRRHRGYGRRPPPGGGAGRGPDTD